MNAGAPMANYAAAKRAGDFVFLSGVVAVDVLRQMALEPVRNFVCEA
jgi:enamine deaminase RidA (YjgF/YER057c/UK114 family)